LPLGQPAANGAISFTARLLVVSDKSYIVKPKSRSFFVHVPTVVGVALGGRVSPQNPTAKPRRVVPNLQLVSSGR
jgi:hypothetical protein